MGTLMQDLKYALRMLAKNPGFTAVVVLSLTLGIGANTAIFSITDNLFLRPLPYPASDRLVALNEVKLDEPDSRWLVSQYTFRDWKKQSQSFEELALIHWNWAHIVEGPNGAEILQGRRVTNGYFEILGGMTSHGRLFLPEEYAENGEPVAILSYAAWQRVFESDAGIVGKGVSFNGRIHTVVGVMSPDFNPLWGKDTLDLWVPVFWRSQNRTGRYFGVIGRLKKDVDIQTAQAEMDVVARRLAAEDPDAAGFGVSVQPLQGWMYGRYVRRWLLPLFGAVLFVLLIACANVANLMLVRANTRDKEFAIRCAVGGGRARLIRQLLTESTLLAVLGAALGVLLAYMGVELMVGLDPDAIPRADEIAINHRVLGFTFLTALVTGLLFGLVPALGASKPNLNESLKETGRRATARLAGRRMHGVLVVAEVALALVLLAGAGLMIHNLWRVMHVDLGFNPENLIAMQISLPELSYCDDGPKERRLKPQAAQVRRRLRERLQVLPGVKAVSVANNAPLWGCSVRVVSVGNQPPPRAGDVNSADLPFACFQPVSPDYFRTLQLPLLKGREFTERDNEGSPAVGIINESFARRHFSSQDPIGKVVRLGHWDKAGEEPPREIVGVVGDSRQVLLQKPIPALYVPYSQLRPGFDGADTRERTEIAYVVRTSIDPGSLAPTMRHIESEVAPDVPIVDIRTIDDIREESMQARDMGFYAWLLGIFAGIAVVLTALGVFGVTSYSVSRRTHEIGIRMAVGAHPQDVLKLILREGLMLTVIGVGIGLSVAFGLTRFLASLLYEVKPTDPVTFVVVSLVLIVMASLACYIPARRATKLDPMAALRYE